MLILFADSSEQLEKEADQEIEEEVEGLITQPIDEGARGIEAA